MLIVSGLGFGHALDAVFDALQKHPRAAACMIEPDPNAWLTAAMIAESDNAFDHPRIDLFGGEGASNSAFEFIKQNYLYLLPADDFAYLMGALPFDADTARRYQEIARELCGKIVNESSRFNEIASAFTQRVSNPLADLPRRVWSCGHRDAYVHLPLLRAFMQGFERIGLHAALSEFDDGFTAPFRTAGELLSARPELIFTINAWPAALLEDLGIEASIVRDMKIPRACWMTDDAAMYDDPPAASPFFENDSIFCADRSYLPWIQQWTQRAFFLPAATMLKHEGVHDSRFAAPVSYIGSLPDVHGDFLAFSVLTQEILREIERRKRLERTERFTTLLAEASPSSESRSQLNHAAMRFTENSPKTFCNADARLEYFLYATATYIRRVDAATAFLPLGLRVFGPPAWRDVLPGGFKDRYGGFVGHGDLANAYASAGCTLNLHSHQCPTCLNTRDFDVLRAGGVCLGDWVEDHLRGMLMPGDETLCFDSIEEGVDLASRIQHDAAEREKIRVAGMKRVMEDHTYEHRARALLNALIDN